MTNIIHTQLKSATLLVVGLALAMLQSPALADNSSPTKKYLLLDSRLIEKTQGVELHVGKVTKHPANPLFCEDKPWEPSFNNLYPNVIYDEQKKIYKCWYSPFIIERLHEAIPRAKRPEINFSKAMRQMRSKGKWSRKMGICYATSKDGLKWTKPLLKDHLWQGKPSNMIWAGPHGAGIYKDMHESDPARRYKMIFAHGHIKGVSVAFSSDGINWSDPIRRDISRADCHNNALWIPELKKYVAITRDYPPPGNRTVVRIESDDFIHWENKTEVLAGPLDYQTYSMPFFRYEGIYLGLVSIFDIPQNRVHTELTWSPDTKKWYRIDQGNPMIANGPGKGSLDGQYDWGCIYAAASPVILENEIRIYYASGNGGHNNWRDGFFCLATLRPDGFAGYETIEKGKSGEILTKAVDVSPGTLRISADVAKGGYIRVAVVDDKNRTIDTCRPITKDVTDGQVKWKNGKPLTAKKIALKFELKNAKLYSFSFGQ